MLSAKSVDERVRLDEDRDIAARTEISCCAEHEERRSAFEAEFGQRYLGEDIGILVRTQISCCAEHEERR